MTRDVGRLTARTFDLLVVGGGIYGLAIAYDATERGLTVALIERGDFGSGNSFNHLRTIHGGLRYLQTLDVGRARESVRERRTLARLAPHILRPLPFVLPLYGSWMTAMVMNAGFLLDRLVAADRNSGVPPSLHLPAGRVISPREAVQRFGEMPRQGAIGAAVWYDYVTLEADRLTFSFAAAAAAGGATLANYVEATAPIVEGHRVAGVRAVDRRDDRELEIAARLTVNATGAAVDHLLGPLGIQTRVPLVKAMNLVTRREAGKFALGARTTSGRHLFLVPWRGRALFGTWQSEHPGAPEAIAVDDEEVGTFVRELNQTFPSLELRVDEVSLVHRGMVPAVVNAQGSASLQGREHVYDHGSRGIQGILSVAGTKYTTARAVAERVVDRAIDLLGRAPVPCRTADKPLPGGHIPDTALLIASARLSHDADLPPGAIQHLVAAHGSHYRDVLEIAASRPDWRIRVAEDSPVIGAELVWAVREEMAVTLSDVVIRRTPLGALGYPGDIATDRAAKLIGPELGWSDERIRDEIRNVRSFYGTLNALKT